MADYDSPWKEALAVFFREFLAFYFPEAHAAIDWSRGHETLDKELQQVIREAEAGRCYVDHLVKVWLQDGTEEWLLIHVEVQTQAKTDFTVRLYTYNYRLFDRYRRSVVTLAVLADESATWRPSHHEFALWGFRVRMEFPTIKLLDIVQTRDDLETNPNPFAALTLAHVRTLQTKHDPEERRVWKFRLVRSLYQRGLSPDAVRQLFRCIEWMMDLPKPLDDLFWEDVDRFEKENKMPYVDIATRKGIERGTVQATIKAILLDWDFRFGGGDEVLRNELRSITDTDLLDKILFAGKSTPTLEELRKLWKSD